MKLANFKWLTKRLDRNDPSENAGAQIVLDFGKYHLSVIDDGYGRDKGLFEIGLFEAADGVANAMTSLPGITDDNDTVKGHLTEVEVDAIIMKLYTITGKEPVQI